MSEWMKKSIEHDKAHYESMIQMTEKKVLGLVEVIKTQCEAAQCWLLAPHEVVEWLKVKPSLLPHRSPYGEIDDAAIAGFAVKLQAAAGELRMYRDLFRQATTFSRRLDEIALEEDGTPLADTEEVA